MKLKGIMKDIFFGKMPIALPVLLLYRFFAVSVLTPFWFFTVGILLRIIGYSYITMNNLPGFFLNPLSWVFLFFWFVLLSFAGLIEQTFLIYCFSRTEQHLEFRFQELWQCIMATFAHPVKRNLIGAAMLSFLLEVLAVGSCTPFLITKIHSFFSVLNFAFASKAGTILMAVGIFLLLYAAALRTFFTEYFVLEKLSAKESSMKNAALMRRSGKRQVVISLLEPIALMLIMVFSYAILVFLFTAVMRIFMSPDRVLAGFMKMSHSLDYLFLVGYDTFSVYLMFRFNVSRFYRLKERMNDLTSCEEEYGYSIEYNKAMKYVSAAVAVIMLALSVGSCYGVIMNGLKDTGSIKGECSFSAHKGQSAEAPENTVPAMLKAAAATADYAELDVHMTADGKLVVMHDASLKRTCGVDKQIIDCDLGYIKTLDAGKWFSHEYEHTEVPTLDEVMDACRGKIRLNIDVKPVKENDIEIADEVVRKIHENGYTNQCVVTSLSNKVLSEIKAKDSDIRTGYILNMASGNFYDMENVDFFSLKYTTVTADIVNRAHLRGKEVWAWTVDKKDDLLKMQSMGVDNVITDDVVYARKVYLEKFNSHSIFGIVKLALTG